jgi:hypothetical protein
MNERDVIALLEAQIRQSSQREQSLLEQIERQSVQIERLTFQIHQQATQQATLLEQQTNKIMELTATIQSMEEAMRERDVNILNLKAQNKALGNLLNNKSEKIKVTSKKASDAPDATTTGETPQIAEMAATGQTPQVAEMAAIVDGSKVIEGLEKEKEKPKYNPKDRGNNQARRKEFFDIETIIEDVYPDDPAFDKQKAKELAPTESILYEFVPGKFIKRIYRQHNYIQDETVYWCKTPKRTPLFNSKYASSFTVAEPVEALPASFS